ncbi:hypothetical protein C1H46_029389 [Malus baccata]|uniref:DUF936 domain-containing protein n=1 Tax=Malus baccata TaxID=106549 RepID=A0A540LF53_MALBA|nr:hypothetical protein C1H46_029389 [Malus baccata]
MASLTPGVLPKLLENAGNKNVKVTGEHRSAVLQVIEIVPCPGGGDDDENDPWNWNSRPRGFLLKLSDSVHSAYVSIAEEDDLNLIYSDKVQLGKLVYVSRLESASPVPVLRGLKVVAVPKCKSKSAPSSAPLVCVGNPDPILHLPKPKAKTRSSKLSTLSPQTKNKTKVAVVVDSSTTTRRLSLDSARRAWDAGTKTTSASHSHHFKSRTKQFSSPPCPAVCSLSL